MYVYIYIYIYIHIFPTSQTTNICHHVYTLVPQKDVLRVRKTRGHQAVRHELRRLHALRPHDTGPGT